MSQGGESKKESRSEAARSFERFDTMLRQGRSFSGRERNCCFLNMGAAPMAAGLFANMSAASGLDYPDDGRAVAVVDWDHDGDLDLWISNRNAPRLRLMLNNTPVENHWVALQLVGNGKTTNRDAIGARVELILKNPKSEIRNPKSIKTLRAGEGFAAQSSKWLHFGLGDDDEIEKVLVRWPNRENLEGDVEEFIGCAVDGRYRLLQGSGQTRTVPTRGRAVELKPSVPKVPPASRLARVPMISLLSAPEWNFQGGSGNDIVSTRDGKPLLINFWASWCTPCLQELVEFRDRADQIRAAGIDVVAACVDGLGEDESDPAAFRAALEGINFPFGAFRATDNLVTTLQNFHDTLIGLKSPLPLPSSFLIDAEGRISVIYKGPLRIDDLLADVNHSRGTRAERWIQSAPLPGRTIDHELVARTEDILEAHTHFFYALHLEKQKLIDDAMTHLREALRYNPEFGLAQRRLGDLQTKVTP